MKKEYYVYGYIRLDTGDFFYIGKGKGNRCYKLNRKNKHFTNIVNKHNVAVVILADNLTEKRALKYEEQAIETLVFELGYSINIENNRSIEEGCHLVNATWGGEGVSGYHWSDEMKQKHSETKTGSKGHWAGVTGENHPAYNNHRIQTVEEKTKRHNTWKKNRSGKNSPAHKPPKAPFYAVDVKTGEKSPIFTALFEGCEYIRTKGYNSDPNVRLALDTINKDGTKPVRCGHTWHYITEE